MHFVCMEITSKDDTEDFRANVFCIDNDNNHWLLKAYGSTPEEVAKESWNRYNDYDNWDVYGFMI